MGILITKTTISFECETDRCGNQSPQHPIEKREYSTKEMAVEANKALRLARDEGWFTITPMKPRCPVCWAKILQEVKDVSENQNE